MNSSSKHINHTQSAILFWVGGLLAFIGFVFPGWLWVLTTPGDVEMLPLTAITAIGIAGIIVLLIAVLKRVNESKQWQTTNAKNLDAK
jgi:hypothetical protein